jgi:hypothetical protein
MVKKRSIIIFLYILLSSAAFGREIKGSVCSGEKGIAGIVVSDGFNFAITDNSGDFTLDISQKAKFVFIITPSGFTAARADGVSQFFRRISDTSDNYHFSLNTFTGKNGYAVIAVGDPQTKNDAHYSIFQNVALPEIKKSADFYKSINISAISIYLGDITWDTMSLFESHKKGMKSLEIPVYTTIGNHDYQKELAGDSAAAGAYEDSFGPAYYGFNLGNNYFIVLDNIIYDTNKKYTEDVDEQQLNWLRKYAELIPSGSRVYVAMHATINRFWIKDYKFTKGHSQLLDILSGFKLSFLTGHTHINSNIEFLPAVMEHNVASSCGAWWNSTLSPDGTPSGFQVFELKEKGNEWYYRSFGKDRDYQMEIYSKGSFKSHPDALVAKIWNWDNKWKVEWFSDDKYMGEMKQFSSTDPAYENDMEKLISDGKIKRAEYERGNYLKPRESFFYFSAVPSASAKELRIVATDRFGRQYSKIIKLDKDI